MVTTDASLVHSRHFRPGEVTLLLEPVGPSPQDRAPVLTPEDLEPLRTLLRGVDVHRLQNGDPFFDPPFEYAAARGHRAPRPNVTMKRGIQRPSVRVLQTVSLASWSPSLHGGPAYAYKDVGLVTQTLNPIIGAGGLSLGNFILRAVSPHWLVVSSQDWGCGGPAGAADFPKPKKRFDPTDIGNRLMDLMRSSTVPPNRGEGVQIAILDTWRSITEARTDDDDLKQRLVDLRNKITVEDKYILLGHPGHAEARPRNCDGKPVPRFDQASHGLFVADIVDSIASRATDLTVYRVLDDNGIGDMEAVAQAMEDAIDAANGEALVMNMSLGFGPASPKLLTLLNDAQNTNWKPEDIRRHRPSLSAGTDPKKTDEELLKDANLNAELRQELVMRNDKSMEAVVYLVSDLPTAVVVASSGNDSCRDNDDEHRGVAPRFPANLEQVVGVSAVNTNWGLCSFSNDDDVRSPDDGISAFGEKLVGPYIASGDRAVWAEWSGTSFAAPIVSGFVACMLSNKVDQATALNLLIFEADNATERKAIKLAQ